MKIRNGFVSNSSSSSFIIVGFKASEVGVNINCREAVEKQVSLKRLDELALKFFTNDTAYAAYRKGSPNDKFWEWAYKETFCSSSKAPKDFYEKEIDGEPYFVKRVSDTVEYGEVEIELDKIVTAVKEVKKEFPNAKVKTFLYHSSE